MSLTVYNACGDSDTKTGILGQNLGVEDMDLGQWTIFPNPVRTQLTLEHTSGVEGMITLVDGLGRTVVELPGNGDSTQHIDVTNLSAGSYVLRIVSDGGFYQQRIQIVK